jgi:hypothetical protein
MDKLEVVQENELYRIALPGEFDVTLPASWPELQNTLINTYPEENSIGINPLIRYSQTFSTAALLLRIEATANWCAASTINSSYSLLLDEKAGASDSYKVPNSY